MVTWSSLKWNFHKVEVWKQINKILAVRITSAQNVKLSRLKYFAFTRKLSKTITSISNSLLKMSTTLIPIYKYLQACIQFATGINRQAQAICTWTHVQMQTIESAIFVSDRLGYIFNHVQTLIHYARNVSWVAYELCYIILFLSDLQGIWKCLSYLFR